MADEKKRAIRYIGASPAVEIGPTGQRAEQGKRVEVREDVARSLLEQDVWEPASAQKKED